jgi:hypothetical protein
MRFLKPCAFIEEVKNAQKEYRKKKCFINYVSISKVGVENLKHG